MDGMKRIKQPAWSHKIIMCLSADTISVPAEQRMAHMHEVAKDDFGLGHPGHDGMYII